MNVQGWIQKEITIRKRKPSTFGEGNVIEHVANGPRHRCNEFQCRLVIRSLLLRNAPEVK